MDFVLICVDRGEAKRTVIEKLEKLDIPFIDVEMGIELVDGRLQGVVRVTTSTPDKREHVQTGNESNCPAAVLTAFTPGTFRLSS